MAARRARWSAAGLAAAAGLWACAGMAVTRSFAPIGDFETSVPRSRAEGGHTPPVVPPDGVSWTVHVDAVQGGDAGASRYEMELVLVDRATAPGTWRLRPAFERAELVDDEGGRFPCTRARVPDLPPDREVDRDEVPTRAFTFVFEVPGSYRFSRMTTLAVHWGLDLGAGEELRVTTRFRAV